MTALRGNVDYLRRHGHEDAVVADLAADAERLTTLIDDLLALSREDAAAPPTSVCGWTSSHARAAAGDRQVVVEAAAPVVVCGDRAALARAVGNLIENARVHGPPAGTITVRAEASTASRVSVVRDEGEGLTTDQAAHAFERFWRARRDVPGSGLGLAIVRATAERHGGRATAQGAEFAIELPLLRELSNDSATPACVSEGRTAMKLFRRLSTPRLLALARRHRRGRGGGEYRQHGRARLERSDAPAEAARPGARGRAHRARPRRGDRPRARSRTTSSPRERSPASPAPAAPR